MHHDAIVYLDMESEAFYDLTIAEFRLKMKQFEYKKQQRKIDLLDQALYISCLVLNKEAKETYDKIYNSIMNQNDKNNSAVDYSKEYEEQQKRINEILIAEAKKHGLNTPSIDGGD